MWGKNVDTEESGFDIVKHKHLLMLVHAPTNYEEGDIITSMALGFYEFAQTFQLVCDLSFSHLKYLPNSGVEECLYFKQFGKGHFDNDRFQNCGCFKTFLVALSHFFSIFPLEGLHLLGMVIW